MDFNKIIHIDMDCFYASIEMRDRPELAHKPMAVGGRADQRGVLCTSNYIARRQYGIRSAMSTKYAKMLCPELIVLPVDMAKYREVADQIREIFFDYTDLVEPLSLDEAYLDVTECSQHNNSGTLIAKEIRARILKNHRLTASAGVAPNKFLAKVASDWKKPDALFVIPPSAVSEFIRALPIEKIAGVGKVTSGKMHHLNIKTCADLQTFSMQHLIDQFGRFGERLYALCRGMDDRTVEPNRTSKSVSVEHTFLADLMSLSQCIEQLPTLCENLLNRLEKYQDRKIQKQFMKIKFNDFQQTSVESGVEALTLSLFTHLLKAGFNRQRKPVRLLGIGVIFKDETTCLQTEFDW